jgi:ABC-type antimicrobial peptide transport system permease subunit
VRRAALRLAWYRLRVAGPRRAGGYVALAVLLGLIGGVALAAVTAARRTESSYPDYLASTNPSAIIAQPNANAPAGATAEQAYQLYEQLVSQMRHLPHVSGAVTAEAFSAGMLTPRGTLGRVLFAQVQLVASADGMFTRQDRVTITAGRPARAPDEVVATSRAAAQLHLHVGSRLPVGILAPGPQGGLPPVHRRVDLLVTGIGEVSTQVVQDDIDAQRTGFLIGTPALVREFGACCEATSYIGLRVAGGGRYDEAVGQEYESLETTSAYYQGSDAQVLQLLEVYDAPAIEAEAQRAIAPEAVALGAFGLIAGLVALIVGAQSVSRQLRDRDREAAVLRALGAGPASAAADGTAGIAMAVVAGAAVAVAVAIGLSPFSLFGPVRQVEPGRGLYLDATVLGLGALALILGLAALTAVLAYRQAPHRAAARSGGGRGSALVRAGVAAGLPPAGIAGLRFALESGRGRTAVPVRAVIAGAVLAVTVGVATLTFGASLDTLVGHPSLYGWNFSYALYSTDGWGPFPPRLTDPALDRDRDIAVSTGVYFLTVQIDGQTVPAILSPTHAAITPRPLSGHALDGPGQIVLGPGTLAQLHRRVGGQVTVQLGPVIRNVRLRIAGTAALPAIGDTFSVHTSLSTGAILPVQVVSKAALDYAGQYSGPNAILIRMRPGVSPAAGLASLEPITRYYNGYVHAPRLVAQAGISALELDASALPPQRPAEIVNYRSMGAMPAILAGGLVAGAVAALGLTLVASVRRRRRDFALLKTLGFTRGQLAQAVAWQATVIAGTGLLLGIPLGIAAGRWVWLVFARQLSAVPLVAVPVVTITLCGLAGLVLVNLIAALPGRAAGRTAAALVLRSE